MSPAAAPRRPRDIRGGAISWMTRNPVTANLLMLALIVGGLLMSFRIRQEVFPQIALDQVIVTVAYPGASPAEVEQGIVLAVEESVRGLDGVKEVSSTASEGVGNVQVDLHTGTDRSKALSDVKNAIDRITSLPEDAERPIVMLPEFKAEAISLVLYGDQPEKVLHALVEQVRDELLKLPEVTSVELGGVRPLEIAVEIPEQSLRAHGLTLDGVAAQVRRTALELPAGGVKTRAGEVLLRTAERRDLGREFADIPVVTTEDGTSVRLGQIAEIKDGYAETDVEAAYNGKPAMMLSVYSIGDQSPTEVATAVKRYVEDRADSLPPGIALSVNRDLSEVFDQRMNLLLRNAAIGLALVLVLLGMFLEPKLAFWVTMGIPISFLGSFLLLPTFDVSLNMISLFAFIVTLGMVVDDAIVVGENAFRLRREGMGRLEAAIVGARRMAMPVFFSIATTVAAFAPLLFIPGTRGKFMNSIPVVVILVLLISLVESFFVLPAHVGHLREGRQDGLLAGVLRMQERFSQGVERFIERAYQPAVAFCVRQRWTTLVVSLTIFLVVLGLVVGGRVKQIDFPREESDWVQAQAALPYGTSVVETRALMQRMVAAAKSVLDEHGGDAVNRGIFSMVGVTMGGGMRTHVHDTGGHLAWVNVGLVSTELRDFGSNQFADWWRERLGTIPGLTSLAFDATTGRTSKPVDLKLSHRDPVTLEAAARALAETLAGFEGLREIEDGITEGKRQLDFTVSAAGAAAGLTPADVASQVRSAFYGAQVLRQQRGRNEIKVLVRLPREEREQLSTIDDLVLRTPTGGEMPLREAAEVVSGRAYTTIERTNGQRTLRVMADIIEGQANAQEVVGALFGKALPALAGRYPGLGYGRYGRQQDMNEFMDYLKLGFAMALLAMFGLIAIPLRSYLQPGLVVMAAIPFGFVGAVVGHLVLGYDMSMLSLMGVVALSGVVVNDSIVLVTAANRRREEGLGATEAAISAATQRFRPILLTTLTTFFGLAPMIFETSVQARMLVPMAISLGFGILISTMFVLLLVPALFTMVENLRERIGRRSEDAPAVPAGETP